MATLNILPINGPILNDGELFTADLHFERLRRMAYQAVMHGVVGPLWCRSDDELFGAESRFVGMAVDEDGSHDAVVAPGFGYVLASGSGSYYSYWQRVNIVQDVTLPVDGPDGSDRTDLILVRPQLGTTDSESRKYMDANGVKSVEPMDTRETESWEFDVLKGTPGAGAPAVPSGWACLAEFTVLTTGLVTIVDTRKEIRLFAPPDGFHFQGHDSPLPDPFRIEYSNSAYILHAGNNNKIRFGNVTQNDVRRAIPVTGFVCDILPTPSWVFFASTGHWGNKNTDGSEELLLQLPESFDSDGPLFEYHRIKIRIYASGAIATGAIEVRWRPGGSAILGTVIDSAVINVPIGDTIEYDLDLSGYTPEVDRILFVAITATSAESSVRVISCRSEMAVHRVLQ